MIFKKSAGWVVGGDAKLLIATEKLSDIFADKKFDSITVAAETLPTHVGAITFYIKFYLLL